MERPQDDTKDEKPTTPSGRPAMPFLNLRSMAEKPADVKPVEVPPLAPSMLRVEQPMMPPPAEVAAETDEEDEDEVDDTPKAVRPAPRASEEAAITEAPDNHEVVDALPEPPPAEAPETFVATEHPRTPEPEPWRPVPRPQQAPAPPAESRIFDRQEARTEATVESNEPILAWQQPESLAQAAHAEQRSAQAAVMTTQAESTIRQTSTEVHRLRRGQAAELLLMVALAGWFNHKLNKQHREEKREFKKVHTALQEQRNENTELKYSVQTQAKQIENTRVALKNEALKTETVADEAEDLRLRIVAAQKAAEAARESEAPGADYRVEHSWYDEAVDREGRVVEGVIEHGRAYHEEKRVETAGSRYHQQSAQGGQQPAHDDPYMTHLANAQAHSRQHNGQVPFGYGLPSNMVDPQHLLDEPSRLRSTLTDPWIWVGVAVLLVAFFTAAFI